MIRKLVFAVVILGLGLVAVALITSSASRDEKMPSSVADEQNPQKPKDVFDLERARNGSNASLESRLGTDDGVVAAMFYGGDTLGSLEVCG